MFCLFFSKRLLSKILLKKKLVSLTLHLFKQKHPCPHAFKPDWHVDWPSNRCSGSSPARVSLFAIFRLMHSVLLQGTTALQIRCHTDLHSVGIDFLGNSFLKVWRKTLCFCPTGLRTVLVRGLRDLPYFQTHALWFYSVSALFVCLVTDLSSYCSNLIGLLVIYSPPFFEYPLLRFPKE